MKKKNWWKEHKDLIIAGIFLAGCLIIMAYASIIGAKVLYYNVKMFAIAATAGIILLILYRKYVQKNPR